MGHRLLPAPAFQVTILFSLCFGVLIAAARRLDAQRILARLQKESRRRYVSAYDVGLVYVGLGQREEAMQWFEKAYRDHCRNLQFSGVEPRLDPLRNDVRFQNLMKRLNLPFQTVTVAR